MQQQPYASPPNPGQPEAGRNVCAARITAFAWIYVHRCGDAGARDRREHGDILSCRPAADPAIALPGESPIGDALRELSICAQHCFDVELARLAAHEQEL